MRRSELDPELAAKLSQLLGAVPTLLAVGVALALPGCSVTELEKPEQARTTGATYPAALWAVAGDVVTGLRALRPALAPGARLVLLSSIQPPALERIVALVTGTKAQRPSLEELCSGLLLSGYLLPAAHALVAGCHVVSAELPTRFDPLDALFAQPSAPPSR